MEKGRVKIRGLQKPERGIVWHIPLFSIKVCCMLGMPCWPDGCGGGGAAHGLVRAPGRGGRASPKRHTVTLAATQNHAPALPWQQQTSVGILPPYPTHWLISSGMCPANPPNGFCNPQKSTFTKVIYCICYCKTVTHTKLVTQNIRMLFLKSSSHGVQCLKHSWGREQRWLHIEKQNTIYEDVMGWYINQMVKKSIIRWLRECSLAITHWDKWPR